MSIDHAAAKYLAEQNAEIIAGNSLGHQIKNLSLAYLDLAAQLEDCRALLHKTEDEKMDLRKDAERYRWLRDRCGEPDGKPYIAFHDRASGVSPPLWADIADTSIDAALRAERLDEGKEKA